MMTIVDADELRRCWNFIFVSQYFMTYDQHKQ